MLKLYSDIRLFSTELLLMTLVSFPVLERVFAVERAAIHQQSASLRSTNATSVVKWGILS